MIGRRGWGAAGAPSRYAVTDGVHVEDWEQKLAIPDSIDIRLRWRMRLFEHYAEVDSSRSDRRLEEAVSTRLDQSDIRQVGFASGSDSQNEDDLATSDFDSIWDSELKRLAVACEELELLRGQAVHAEPLSHLPSDPSTSALLLASAVSLLACASIFGLEWHETNRRSIQANETNEGNALAIPASWFRKRATPLATTLRTARIVSSVILVGAIALVAYRASMEPLGWARLWEHPLAELSRII